MKSTKHNMNRRPGVQDEGRDEFTRKGGGESLRKIFF